MRIKWKLWKRTYPYICGVCTEPHSEMGEICESCGTKNSLRKVYKKDYKIRKLLYK